MQSPWLDVVEEYESASYGLSVENFFSKNQESFNLSSNEDTDFDENLPLNSREYGSLHPIKMVESKRKCTCTSSKKT